MSKIFDNIQIYGTGTTFSSETLSVLNSAGTTTFSVRDNSHSVFGIEPTPTYPDTNVGNFFNNGAIWAKQGLYVDSDIRNHTGNIAGNSIRLGDGGSVQFWSEYSNPTDGQYTYGGQIYTSSQTLNVRGGLAGMNLLGGQTSTLGINIGLQGHVGVLANSDATYGFKVKGTGGAGELAYFETYSGNPSVILKNDGNVGVGGTPFSKFTLYTPSNDGMYLYNSQSSTVIGAFRANANGAGNLLLQNSANTESISLIAGGSSSFSSGSQLGVGGAPFSQFTLYVKDGDGQYIYTPATNQIIGFLGTDSNNNARLYLANSASTIGVNISSTGNTYFNGGNVGVGTTSPNYKLEVVGSNNSTIQLVGDLTTSIATAVISSRGLFGTTSNHDLGFVTNGSERLTILNSGNVGVGTTSPSVKLHTKGNSGFYIESDDVGYGSFKLRPYSSQQNYSSIQSADGDELRWGGALGSPLSNGEFAFYNTANTNVRLAINNLNPTANLTIAGSRTDTANKPFRIENSASTFVYDVYDNGAWEWTTFDNIYPQFKTTGSQFQMNWDAGSQLYHIYKIGSVAKSTYFVNTNLSYWQQQANIDWGIIDANSNAQFWFDEDVRRIGIGTQTPSSKLHVVGNRADNATNTLAIQNSALTNTFVVRDDGIILAGNSTTWDGFSSVQFKKSGYIYQESPQGYKLNDNSGTGGFWGIQSPSNNLLTIERFGIGLPMMTFDSNAFKVGIFTTSPTAQLHLRNATYTDGFRIQSVNGTDLVFDYLGRLGINNATPSEKLHVSGGTIRINTSNGTEGAGKFAISDSNGSISFSSTTDLGLSTSYGTVGGTGTAGYIAKWNSSTGLTNSLLSETGTGVTVMGSVYIYGNVDVLGSASTFNTTTIQTADNSIAMNLSGSHVSAYGGGIIVLSGRADNISSTWTIDETGAWSSNTPSIFTGLRADSNGYTLRTYNSATTSTFAIRDDGAVLVGSNMLFYQNKIGIDNFNPTANLDIVSGNDTNNPIRTVSSNSALTRNVFINGGGVQTDIQVGNNNGSNSFYLGVTSSSVPYLDNRTNNKFEYQIVGSAVLAIDTNGNLGIGTTSPSDKLHISNGTIRINDVGSTYGAGKLAVSDANGSISFSSTTALGLIAAGVTGTTNYVTKWSSNTAITNSIVYDDGTNVGIGTNNPGAKLDVNGNIYCRGSFILTPVVGTYNSTALELRAAQELIFQPYGSEVARFNSTGLGIGTTSALDKLHISNGTIRINDTGSTYGAGKLAVSDANGSISFSSTTALGLGSGNVTKYTTTQTFANSETKTITHSLGTQFVHCSVWDNATNELISAQVVRTSGNTTNAVDITIATAGSYDILITG